MKNILIVDDDPFFGPCLFRGINKSGYKTVLVSDAEAALDVLAGQQIDLCIIDLALPGKSGLDLIKQLRDDQRFIKMPIIIQSGFAATVQQEIIRLAPLKILQKPYAVKELSEFLDEHFRRESA